MVRCAARYAGRRSSQPASRAAADLAVFAVAFGSRMVGEGRGSVRDGCDIHALSDWPKRLPEDNYVFSRLWQTGVRKLRLSAAQPPENAIASCKRGKTPGNFAPISDRFDKLLRNDGGNTPHSWGSVPMLHLRARGFAPLTASAHNLLNLLVPSRTGSNLAGIDRQGLESKFHLTCSCSSRSR